MKTMNGQPIKNFKRLEKPEQRQGELPPLIFTGEVEYDGQITTIKWDEEGKCANRLARGYFIHYNDLPVLL